MVGSMLSAMQASVGVMDLTAQLEGVWSEEDTTPSHIEDALRNLLVESYEKERAYAPARVLNLVVIVDRAYKGEISNRLERVGRYHPSRTVLLSNHMIQRARSRSAGERMALSRQRCSRR